MKELNLDSREPTPVKPLTAYELYQLNHKDRLQKQATRAIDPEKIRGYDEENE